MRKSYEERHNQLLKCGAALAEKFGPSNVTRRMIAKKCKVSESLVNRYLGSNEDMRKAITKAASEIPDKKTEKALGIKLRRTNSHGGARLGAGRPTTAQV